MRKINPDDVHVHKAVILQTYDGDTFKVIIDTDFFNTHTTNLRLYGLDTKESRGKGKCKEGIEVYKKVLRQLLPGGEDLDDATIVNIMKAQKRRKFVPGTIDFRPILVRTHKIGKYAGRYLGEVIILRDGKQINLNQWLLKNKYAKGYWGGKRDL